MDDFEKNYPNFDWKNTPMPQHPDGINCPCPKHEYLREQSITCVQTMSTVRMKLCPDHYKVYFNEIYPTFSWHIKLSLKIMRKVKLIGIMELPYMQSDQCFYCRFGTGGRGKKSELPPVG